MIRMRARAVLGVAVCAVRVALALDHPDMVSASGEGFCLLRGGQPTVSIDVDSTAAKAVHIAAANLAKDFKRVGGTAPPVGGGLRPPRSGEPGVLALPTVRIFVKPDGRREAYTMTVAKDGITIVGSDRRGAVYGI